MTTRTLPLAVLATAAFAFVGCASISSEGGEEGSSSTASSERSSSESGSRAASEGRRSESSTQTASTAKSDSDGPRSSWRTDRENQRDSRPVASGSNPDHAKVVEQLNEASRELAALRAANAKLRAEKAQPASSSSSTARTDPADEKLAASLKSFGQFKQEVASLFTEIERMRKEQAGLNQTLKAAIEQADQAKSSMSRLESDLRAEKRSRAEAEKVAAELRDQLRLIARALSSAGLSVDKLSASTGSSTR